MGPADQIDRLTGCVAGPIGRVGRAGADDGRPGGPDRPTQLATWVVEPGGFSMPGR